MIFEILKDQNQVVDFHLAVPVHLRHPVSRLAVAPPSPPSQQPDQAVVVVAMTIMYRPKRKRPNLTMPVMRYFIKRQRFST